MQVEIQSSGFEHSQTLHAYIERRLNSTFQFSRRKVRRITVRLFSEAGVYRRTLKVCRVMAVVNGLPNIVTEYRGKNFYVAADIAIQRSNRAVSKRLRKLRNVRRHLIHQPIGSLV